jgi:L-seryl-tRNA(Ser) seleniumtransferase
VDETERPPSVDALARSLRASGLPAPLLVDAARRALAEHQPSKAADYAEEQRLQLLLPVINATGVILHTNLGRAPVATEQPSSYVNLELDLTTGKRGTRQRHVGALLARACGAEAALVVNNCAAAILLVLAALARGRGVAVSRGELIEIGGEFRLPDIMAESGADLVEVGTTNRTRPDDYGRVLDRIALVLKVHQSNYRITGFTATTSVPELARLGPPVVVDLGSGLLDARCPWLEGPPPPWLASEPAVRQTLDEGAALVTFSGDKLFGGPQAGLIVGRADLIERCVAHPIYRVVRPGALLLRSLQDVALGYLHRDHTRMPIWQMATTPVADLRTRADRIAAGVTALPVTSAPSSAIAGGGSLPGLDIPSWGLHLPGDRAAELRHVGQTPVIARVDRGQTVLDLRTVDPEQDAELARSLHALAR